MKTGRSVATSTSPISARDLSRRQIRQVQIGLNRNGFDAGHVDGRWGPKTKRALINFERHSGIRANGRLNSQALSKLGVKVSYNSNGSQSSSSSGAMTEGRSAATSRRSQNSNPDQSSGMKDSNNSSMGGGNSGASTSPQNGTGSKTY